MINTLKLTTKGGLLWEDILVGDPPGRVDQEDVVVSEGFARPGAEHDSRSTL